MGLISIATLETVLTFQFLIPASIIAAAMLFGLDYLAKQEAAEKDINYVPCVADNMNITLSELGKYNGTSSGKPILLSILGKVYDVGAGKAHYGVGGQYHQFAGKDISVACAKFNKTNAALFNTKWLNLSKDERALLTKWENVIAAKYEKVGKVSDPESFTEVPGAEGDAEVHEALGIRVSNWCVSCLGALDGVLWRAASEAFSTQLGLGLFEKGHIVARK